MAESALQLNLTKCSEKKNKIKKIKAWLSTNLHKNVSIRSTDFTLNVMYSTYNDMLLESDSISLICAGQPLSWVCHLSKLVPAVILSLQQTCLSVKI